MPECFGELVAQSRLTLQRAGDLLEKEGLGQVEQSDIERLGRVLEEIARRAYWLRGQVDPLTRIDRRDERLHYAELL